MRVLALPPCRCWIDVLPGNTAEGLGGQSQDFACTLSAKRRLCNTVGRPIGRAKPALNIAAPSLPRALGPRLLITCAREPALVLRALFWRTKSCALVNLFTVCPRFVGE
jgi:hypothetical protein